MAITVTPSGQALGAAITGIDLSREMDAKDVADIHAAWMEHLVIYFPDQKIQDEDQIRFAAHFGKVGAYHRPLDRQHPKHASNTVMLIGNLKEDGQAIGAHPDGEMMFHTDTAYHQSPHKATTLYATHIPSVGGNTVFSNQYKVYEALPGEMKRKLQGLTAMNVYEFGTTVKDFDRYDRDKVPHYAHPVFRRHPETGRPAMYVAPLMTEEIIGLDEAESRHILARIFALQAERRFLYEHVWKVGHLVMWDNRCTTHARTDFDPAEERLLRRVTIGDEAAVMAA